MSEMFNKDKPNFVGIGFVLILLSNMFYPEFIMQAMAAWLLYLLTAIFFHVVFVFIDDRFSMKTLEDGQPIFITYKNKTVPIYWYAIVDAINFILWLALSLLNFSFILRIVENMDYAIGCCFLIVILLSGLTNFVKFFFKKFNPTYDAQDGETYDDTELISQKYTQFDQAFIYAVSVGNIEAVKHTLKLGANINSKYSNGVAALILSIRNEHYDVTKFLIENGADVNLTDDKTGTTAMIVAAIKGQVEIVKLLIGNGADIDVSDFLQTPLTAAIFNNNYDVIELLLQNGADIEKPDVAGDTPLCIAVTDSTYEIIELLIAYGVNVNQDCNSKVLFDINKHKNNNNDILHRNTAIFKAIRQNNKDVIELLLNNGADIDAIDLLGNTPLLAAKIAKKNDICDLLLSRGASTDIKNYFNLNIEQVDQVLNKLEIKNQKENEPMSNSSSSGINVEAPRLPSIEMSPRQIIFDHFKSLKGELPIYGGWGYTKEDAVVIDKNDSTVTPGMPFDGVGIEYIFVEKRIYEELIIFRSKNDKYAGIRWNLVKQSVISDDGKDYDHLIFNVTAFKDSDLDELKNEWESNNGFYNNPEEQKIHEHKRDSKMIKYTTDYWFDITSFYKNR